MERKEREREVQVAGGQAQSVSRSDGGHQKKEKWKPLMWNSSDGTEGSPSSVLTMPY